MSEAEGTVELSDHQGDKITGPLIGIGASAGGVEALKEFFAKVPQDCGMSFVVVQHLSSDHWRTLFEELSRESQVRIRALDEATEVELNTAYIAPPDAAVTVTSNILMPMKSAGLGLPRMPIDQFFRSLAVAWKENAVGIILSGAGSDGALGLQAIKRHGGLTIVQTPDTARFDAMPRAAIALGVADRILQSAEIPDHLISHFAFQAQRTGDNGDDEAITAALPAIFRLLHETLGHDFSRYKQSTLIRRIRRRMQMLRIKPAEAYADVLGKDRAEAEQLFRDLIIGVTEFFRDPDVFEVLEQAVIPKLFKDLPPDGTLRVWAAGCATGEEAYSLAILLREYMDRVGQVHPVQIFATDVDAEAIDAARLGFYREEISERVSPQRLERFFVEREGGFQVRPDIRDMCVFSAHNLIHDPPFSRMSLVLCRNVLIYFEAGLQQRVLPLFHYALEPGGFLVLGPAESLGHQAELFHPVEKRLRIFQVNSSTRSPSLRLPRADAFRFARIAGDTTLKAKLSRERDAQQIHEQALLDWYVPPSVLLDGQGEVLHFARQTAAYLQPPVGSPSNNIFDIVRDDLRIVLRAALTQARKINGEIIKHGIPLGADGALITLVVRPVNVSGGTERYLVLFRDEPAVPRAEPISNYSRPEEIEAVQQLERELRLTKQWLQSTVEELENSNEELKSSNEELIAINEEYQSANEALQTSKEELQSLNEEMEMMNTELTKKVDELDAANADLRGLFASSAIATIFVDPNLRIRRFTVAASKLFNLVSADIGRSLEDITARFDTAPIIEAVRTVIGGSPVPDAEMRTADGRSHYVCRITALDGSNTSRPSAVLNLIDVTDLKLAQEALQREAEHKDQFIALLGHELRNPLAPLKIGLESLRSPELDPASRTQILDIFHRQIDHLSKIVDDLLDVSRISKGVVTLQRERLCLSTLVQETSRDYQRVFNERNITLSIDIEPQLFVEGDRTRLIQVLTNLLHNAEKFTPSGQEVRVSLRQEKQMVVLEVSDTGEGMDAEILDGLFQPFRRRTSAHRSDSAGLGLGLALVRGLAELHQGTASATSDGPGLGSTFVVTLPSVTAQRAEDRTPTDKNGDRASVRRILIIEDNVDAASTLSMLLVNFGHSVQVAHEGRTGLDLVKSMKPDTVICDIGLPGEIDGFEVARAIRNLDNLAQPTLIALTGFGQPADKEHALEAGFDRHLTKPIDRQTLVELFGVNKGK